MVCPAHIDATREARSVFRCRLISVKRSLSTSTQQHFPIWAFGQQRTETRPSVKPGNWPPFLGREVPHSGAKVKRGEDLSSLRALREAAQRVTCKGSNPPVFRGERCRQQSSSPYPVSSCSSPSASTRADSFAVRDTHSHEVNSFKNVMTLLRSSTDRLCSVRTRPRYSSSRGAPGPVCTRLCTGIGPTSRASRSPRKRPGITSRWQVRTSYVESKTGLLSLRPLSPEADCSAKRSPAIRPRVRTQF